ncbi:hypothetical protein TCAL_12791 [Tigriopus californicus]|uniref:Ribosomal L1 domain-containing protein 1 n=1 Tax=Tigriopus californicus TaxID=6832 RepID=A0A553NUW3_TIGCA|nr:ribosomal L1 domain-containing protein 1-like [Tigriopus californicus]TRY69215.1 hypothetical protein TCAL_12791 [Tigriopus californicus]
MTLKTPRSATPRRKTKGTPPMKPGLTPSPAQPALTRSAQKGRASTQPLKKTPAPRSLKSTPGLKPVKRKTRAPATAPTPAHLILEEGGASLIESKIRLAVSALKSVNERAKGEHDQLRPDLFEDEATRINVQVVGIKLPKDGRQQLLHVPLPHDYLVDPSDVCLVVKDLEKGIRPDHEPTQIHFQEMLSARGVTGIAHIMPLRELKVEYKTFESKTALCHRYEKFLCDDRIVRLVPKFFGKPFYRRKKFPTPVNLRAAQLSTAIHQSVRTSVLPLSHHGSCAMITVGHLGMDDDHIVANVLALGQKLAQRYPGGWKNIRSIHLKSEKSLAIPVHISTLSANEVGYVDADVPKRITREVVEDELSTRPGMKVKVTPSGSVFVTQVPDPDWDNEKDEPFVEGSDDEERDEPDENDAKKSKTTKGQKRKLEEGKPSVAVAKNGKNAKNAQKAKAAKKTAAEEESDDDIDQAEMEYMKRVADEEEEIERKEAQEKDVKPKESEDEEDESEDDDNADASLKPVNGVGSDSDEDFEDDEDDDDEDDDEEEGDDDQEVEEIIMDDDDDDEDADENDDDDDEEGGEEEEEEESD